VEGCKEKQSAVSIQYACGVDDSETISPAWKQKVQKNLPLMTVIKTDFH